MKKLILITLSFLSANMYLHAQDTLPKFQVKNFGNNRIVVGWINNFQNIRQLSIQRSADSLVGYKTIVTIPDPTTPQNGYVDTKAPHAKMFYRIYIMLDKGAYLFSDAKRPVLDTTRRAEPVLVRPDLPATSRIDSLKLATTYPIPVSTNPTPVKPKPDIYKPSLYVYTYRDGYVRINLPENDKAKKYSIKFFEETGTPLFELKEIKERDFKIDKTNFYHAGWFRFELYEDGKLFEKHKFYIEKEF